MTYDILLNSFVCKYQIKTNLIIKEKMRPLNFMLNIWNVYSYTMYLCSVSLANR